MRGCREFHALLPRLLRPEGIYSYFNGLAADNAFFHTVYCHIARAELEHLGLQTAFVALPIDCSNPKIWEGIRYDAEGFPHFSLVILCVTCLGRCSVECRAPPCYLAVMCMICPPAVCSLRNDWRQKCWASHETF